MIVSLPHFQALGMKFSFMDIFMKWNSGRGGKDGSNVMCWRFFVHDGVEGEANF
jgi:hypothetical protein